MSKSTEAQVREAENYAIELGYPLSSPLWFASYVSYLAGLVAAAQKNDNLLKEAYKIMAKPKCYECGGSDAEDLAEKIISTCRD